MKIDYREKQMISRVSSGIFGFSGCQAKWGNLGLLTPIDTQQKYIEHFGTPLTTQEDIWFQSWNFLSYSPNLLFFRFGEMGCQATFDGSDDIDGISGSANAHIFVNSVSHADDYQYWKVLNSDDALNPDLIYFRANDLIAEKYNPLFLANQSLFIASKYPGEKGNDFSISIATNVDDFSSKFVFDDSDSNVIENYYFSELFNRRLSDREFAIVVINDYEIVETRICSTNYLDENFADNEEFETIVIHVNPDVTAKVSSLQDVPLLWGKNDEIVTSDVVAQISQIPLSVTKNIAVMFFSSTHNDIINELIARKLDSQLLINASVSTLSSTLRLPELEKGKWLTNPFTHEVFQCSYSGDIAGVIVTKLNSNSFSEIFTLPDREFQNLLSAYEYESDETRLTNRQNIISRKGNKFFLDGNFSDVEGSSLASYLNIRILLLYVELNVSVYLQSLLFETTVDDKEITTRMDSIKKSVRRFLSEFDYTLDIDKNTITVTLFETINKIYRKLVFEVDYQK